LKNSRILFVLLAVFFSYGNAIADDFNFTEKPAAAPISWAPMYGEYLLGEEKLLFREDGGRFQVIFNPPADGMDVKGLRIWSLDEEGTGSFLFKDNKNISNFIFEFDKNGDSSGVSMDGKMYRRNFIEPRDGNTFKVSLEKSIEEYTKIALEATPPSQKGSFRDPDLVDVTTILDHVKLDIRYATTNNFLNVPTYSQAKSFLHRPALTALNRANKRLNQMGFGIMIHDTYRPWYVTKIFWDATEGAERDFVANPESGSKHNMGSAVDMTLYDLETGEVIKMVGTYDEMSDRSYPLYMGGTSLERWHRDLMRIVVENEGFKVVSNEWWHFDHEDWRKYPILNLTFEELLKN